MGSDQAGDDAFDALAGALRDRLLAEAGRRGTAGDLHERIRALVDREAGLLDDGARARLAARVAERAFGLGPLEPLLGDPTVDEVMVNGPGQVWVELPRRGGERGRRRLGLAQLLDEKAGARQGARVRLERPVDALEGHGHPVVLEVVGEAVLREVVVECFGCTVERMDDRKAEPSAGLEHAGDLRHRAGQVVHVVQGHERHGKVEAPGLPRQPRGIAADHLVVAAGLTREAGQRRGAVDSRQAVPLGGQRAPHPALAASDIQRSPARRRDERVKGRPVELLVIDVVPGDARPPFPSRGVALPGVAQGPESLHPAILAQLRRSG